MKICVLYLNCHYLEILRYLNLSSMFINEYDIYPIISYEVINIGYFNDIQIDKLKNSKLLISHNVSDKHGKFSFNNIKNIVDSLCEIITLTFYRFDGYWYNIENLVHNHIFLYPKIYIDINILLDNVNEDNYNFYINKLLDEDIKYKDEYVEKLNSELNNFLIKEKDCSIKMYDYLKENYKKYKLFVDMDHPSSIFFCQLVKNILSYLNYDTNDIILFNDDMLAIKSIPITNRIKKSLNLEFDCSQIKYMFIDMTTKQWFEMYLKLNYFSKYKTHNNITTVEEYTYIFNTEYK